ncbi:MAG TPA: VWA domain-containing protein [Salinimicrobium sp.]|nr:VWA domain-containing protein [Salinimicrobium sp.]
MSTATVIYIILAAITAAGLAYFFYFFKSKKAAVYPWLLWFLRFIAVFSLLLLIINPEIVKKDYYLEKPKLVLAVDNSASIAHFDEVEPVSDFIESIKAHKEVQDRFDLEIFAFDDQLEQPEAINFDGKQTNIHNALSSIENLFRTETVATVLVSDGNQTYGRDYSYFDSKSNHHIFPVIVGDTTSYIDVSIDRINLNNYAFLGNKFPVEVILNYQIENQEQTKFQIKSGNNILYSTDLVLEPNESSKVLDINLPANNVGTKFFTASVIALENEKNKINNQKKFAVEVIDQRAEILLLTDILHPDIGAIKRSVEMNKSRGLVVKNVTENNIDFASFQSVFLYQPNAKFRSVFESLNETKSNYFIISGSKTDWNFLNTVQSDFRKEVTNQTEDFLPVFNENYAPFQIEKGIFENYPPLLGLFGSTEINSAGEILLFQKISGIVTEEPLLVTVENKSQKHGILLGENIWKWRAQSYVENKDFDTFDTFFGKIVQYFSKNEKRERLKLSYDPIFYENQEVTISAQYFDENYEFDPRQQLQLSILEEGTQRNSIPFVLKDNNYGLNLGAMPSGNYEFVVSVKDKGISKKGYFEIEDYSVEQQFMNADLGKMKQLAQLQKKQLFFLSEKEDLLKSLLDNPEFIPVQKSKEVNVPLIDWFYLLAIIAIALSAEWFLRKYHGLI